MNPNEGLTREERTAINNIMIKNIRFILIIIGYAIILFLYGMLIRHVCYSPKTHQTPLVSGSWFDLVATLNPFPLIDMDYILSINANKSLKTFVKNYATSAHILCSTYSQ